MECLKLNDDENLSCKKVLQEDLGENFNEEMQVKKQENEVKIEVGILSNKELSSSDDNFLDLSFAPNEYEKLANIYIHPV